ncbi:MAG: precorrin-6y C5,15-methyltransferase (decarboxylating) subunit CbiE [Acidimicrobiales bacterium]
MLERVTVVGISADGAPLAPAASAALERAALVVGGRRHLTLAPDHARTAVLDGDIAGALDMVESTDGEVCVLASGDPGFFGIVRALAARLEPGLLTVHPAVSSVAAAFARLGLPWDDACVVSAHGRPLESAAPLVAGAGKAAVLVSPDNPPEALGKALLAIGVTGRAVAVCSRLGYAEESVTRTDLAGLAGGTWDPLSVVVLLAGDNWTDDLRPTAEAVLAWGRPETAFEHRSGLITKAEVRAVVLGKLGLPRSGVLWDVGAGSASVAIEAASLSRRLNVYAVERNAQDAQRARRNVIAHGVAVTVVEGAAPDALSSLPDPDRVFVGGGGLSVVQAALGRLRPGGRIVAAFTAVDRAAAGARLLGNLVQLAVSRGAALPDGAVRLAAENPVFVAWGPEP